MKRSFIVWIFPKISQRYSFFWYYIKPIPLTCINEEIILEVTKLDHSGICPPQKLILSAANTTLYANSNPREADIKTESNKVTSLCNPSNLGSETSFLVISSYPLSVCAGKRHVPVSTWQPSFPVCQRSPSKAVFDI